MASQLRSLLPTPMETTHRFVTADGATIAYRRWHAPQPDGGPPLLLIHGAASNLTRWSEFVETSSVREYRDILRLDLRGHAGSLWRGRLTLETWADDIATLLQREHIPRAVVAGHCLGANIAVMFAARHPSLVAGMVLIEPMLAGALTGTLGKLRVFALPLRLVALAILAINRLGLYRRRFPLLDLQELDRQFRPGLMEPKGDDALTRRYASPLHDVSIMPTACFLQDLIEVTRPVPLPAVRAPILAILSSGNFFADHSKTLVAFNPLTNCTIKTVDAKHWIPTEKPVVLRELMDGWLRSGLKQT